MESKLISNRRMARTLAANLISPALLLLCSSYSSATLAQERVVMDLPLPPVASARLEDADLARSAHATVPPVKASELKLASATPAQPVTPTPTSNTTPGSNILQVTLREGESLYRIFRRHNLNQGDLLNMLHSSDAIKRRLRRMRAGQQLSVDGTPDGRVNRVVLGRPSPSDIAIERQAASDKFTMRALARAPQQRQAPPAPHQASSAAQIPNSQRPTNSRSNESNAATQVAAQAIVEKLSPPPSTHEPRQAKAQPRQITVKAGDSLYAIFNREGIPPSDLATLLRAGKPADQLRRLRPGQNVILGLAPDRTLLDLSVELDETRTLTAVRKDADSFAAVIETQPLERRVTTASATIEDALFLAGQRAGLSDRLMMEMVEIFGWDVDFALDVRAGDRFTVVYEELYKDGEKVRDGNILASEFHNRGRSIRAVRYSNKAGRAEYFSPEGFSMRKAFLRTPVNFSRISSRFDNGRIHPVLQRMRAHKGVDYAAARGTPIKAAGHGRVVFAGRKGGYGKTVVLQHGGTYTTLYAHMSRIHSRAKTGKRVQQGDIIGYVGKTGLATGPHLHYEFRVRGVHKDPLRVKLPKALPIDPRYKQDFQKQTRALVAQLDALANTSIASRD